MTDQNRNIDQSGKQGSSDKNFQNKDFDQASSGSRGGTFDPKDPNYDRTKDPNWQQGQGDQYGSGGTGGTDSGQKGMGGSSSSSSSDTLAKGSDKQNINPSKR
jgi:hypothetical protein